MLHKRGELSAAPGKVQPLPPASMHQGNTHSENQIPDKVQVKAATGWRNFGVGISVSDAAV